MIEHNWERRPFGIRPYPHLLMTPPFVLITPVAGRTSKRPVSVYTALSELRFVSDQDEDTFSPTHPDTNLPPLSPISQLQFASPEETMTLITPIEFAEPSSREPPLPFTSTNIPSPGVREEQTQITPGEPLPLTTCTASQLPQQPGPPVPRLDSAAIPGPTRIGRRPLPELPEHGQSRPLPPRPTGATAVPCLKDSNRLSPRKESILAPPNYPWVLPRPVLGPEHDTRCQSVEDKRPKLDPTPEDTPPVPHPPAPAIISPPTTSPLPDTSGRPPALVIPVVLPITPKSNHAAPIPLDLLSPSCIDLVTAAGLTLTGENGEQVSFGALFRDRKVIVILIRHFRCLFCKDYVRSISNLVTPEILGKKGVELVLIGNGGPGMIKAYKKSLKLPFAMYTDSSRQLYNALGLFKTSSQKPESLRKQATARSYGGRNGRWASLRVAVREAAVKAVHCSESGDPEQLGGEFVFGPGLKTSFVYKMQNPGDHAPIVKVLEAAGLDICEKVIPRASDVGGPAPTLRTPGVVDIYLKTPGSTPEPSLRSPSTGSISTSGTTSTTRVSISTDGKFTDSASTTSGKPQCEPPTPKIENKAEWMIHRSNSLTRIKEKREARRRGDIVQ